MKKIDTEQEAYELILFLNHLLRIIDQSKGKFTIENTLKRVFDDSFLPKTEFVEYIIKDIPLTKKYEVAIKVFTKREKSKNKSDLAVFWNALMNDLKPKELEDIQNEISQMLRYAETTDEVTSVVFLVGEDWKNLEHDSRLRAENLLIRNLPTWLADDPRNGPDASVYEHITNALYRLYIDDMMELREEFASKIYTMLEKSSPAMTGYVANYFGGILKEIDDYIPFKKLDDIIIKRFKSGDRELLAITDEFYSEKEASKLKEHLPPKSILDDDLPF